MESILVISPHPDDETLGCGGTLLRHKDNGDKIYWLIVTGINEESGWSNKDVIKRDFEIEAVINKYDFNEVYNFRLPTTKIDTVPLSILIEQITDVYKICKPGVIYMPFAHDVHTDHKIIAMALQSTFKWFRFPHIYKVLMYETLSETEFDFVSARNFRPNIFSNISEYLDEKIEIMKIYESEMGNSPFPRSEETIRSLAVYRGSQGGFRAAEAFELVYERK